MSARPVFRCLAAVLLLWGWGCKSGSDDNPLAPDNSFEPGGEIPAVELTPSSAELFLTPPGNTIRLSALVRDYDGGPMTGVVRSFSSDDTNVATVDSSGIVTARSVGTTGITVTFANASDTTSATARIVVFEPPVAIDLGFAQPPAPALAGLYLSPVRVFARDSAGNAATRFEGPVMIGLASGSRGGQLLGTTTVQAVRGIATFEDLHIDVVGGGYTLEARASGLNAATSAAFEVAPAGRITFVSDRGGTPKIHLMNADGSGVRQITFGSAPDSRPAWSPDGRRIAFARADDSGSCGIYVVNDDGSGLSRLTNACGDRTPTWSPDGRRIAFAKWTLESLATGIYLMDADGSGVTRLTESLLDEYPDWSPDGSRIAFTRYSEHPVGDWIAQLHVMEADGSGIRGLTSTGPPTFAEGVSAWSPDGSTIAFWSFGYGVALVSATGGFPRMVYKGASDLFMNGDVDFYASPDWSPDGRKLVFARGEAGARELVIANASGGGPLQTLSDDSPGEDTEPAWIGSQP